MKTKGLHEIHTKGTLAEKAYIELKKAIFELDLKPGQLVLEDDLARDLGVSRTPVRTALIKLSFEGLIEIVQGKGTFISELSKKQFTDMMVVRRALEQISVTYAALHRSDRDIAELREMIDKMQATINAGINNMDSLSYILGDVMFHIRIAKICDNTYLQNQLHYITTNISRHILATLDKSFLYVVDDEHKGLLEAITGRDADKASELVQIHLDNVEQRTLKRLL